MPIAVCLIRDRPHYRHEAFVAGLTALGYRVQHTPARRIAPDDVLVIWNRSQGMFAYEAARHDVAGSPVIVAENGYLDAVDADGHQLFSLALDHHNGAGRWFVGDEPRLPLLQVELQPWRAADSGLFILVLPQRGIGAPGVAMPRGWPFDIRKRLARLTSRPVRVREHPGGAKNVSPLTDALKGCHAVVTWGSGAALKALAAGYPVFHEMPSWIGAQAARPFGSGVDLEDVKMDGLARGLMFIRLAWSQWPVADIASGRALKWLLTQGNP